MSNQIYLLHCHLKLDVDLTLQTHRTPNLDQALVHIFPSLQIHLFVLANYFR